MALVMAVAAACGDDDDDEWHGADANLPSLVEAERTGDFEGVLTWVLGLNEEAGFRVYELEEPYRLVVDVAHP
jgi:hypothetical protein